MRRRMFSFSSSEVWKAIISYRILSRPCVHTNVFWVELVYGGITTSATLSRRVWMRTGVLFFLKSAIVPIQYIQVRTLSHFSAV